MNIDLKFLEPYLIYMIFAFLGLLILYIKTYTTEKAKMEVLKSENKKLIEETERIKKDFQLEISKRRYQYESKKEQYILFFKLLDQFTNEANKSTQEKLLPILDEFNRNFLNSSSRNDKKGENNGAGAFLCPTENYMTLVDFGQVKVIGGQQGSRSNSTRLYTIPGEPCRAPANGVVVFAGDLALTGSTVVIDHGCGVRSYLYGLQEFSVTRGQTVERGQAVGVLGEELTMDFKLGSKSVNPWPLFQTSGGLFWQEKG